MCCQAPNQPPNCIPKLGLDDLRRETMHAKLDKTKDSLDNSTISCSQKELTALRIDVRYLARDQQYLDSTFIEQTRRSVLLNSKSTRESAITSVLIV